MRWFSVFRRPAERIAAESLYIEIVTQARAPGFYAACCVPDTPDGRYDMIMAHLALMLRRLHRHPAETRRLSQSLFDLMFADMDQNLREMGVGDLAVGKRVKAMAKAFYGRLAAYDAALSASDNASLASALLRNVYRKSNPGDAQVAVLVGYLCAEADRLDAAPLSGLLAGNWSFGSPPSAQASREPLFLDSASPC